jgi:hypothetical protein
LASVVNMSSLTPMGEYYPPTHYFAGEGG